MITSHKIPEGLENLRIIWLGEKDGNEFFDIRVDVEFVRDYKKAQEFVDMIAEEYHNDFEYKHDKPNVIRNIMVIP